jgi:hypothetical protein
MLDGVHPFEAYKSLGKKDWHDYETMKGKFSLLLIFIFHF